MKTIDDWLTLYGRDHQNSTNKFIHWVCVPVILFSVLGLFMQIPFPYIANGWVNVATIFLVLALLFYLRLSIPIFLGMIVVGGLAIFLNRILMNELGVRNHLYFSIALFVVAWIFQFIGHKIEGQKPSFFEDMQFLLIGPIWLLHFLYKKVGIPYK